jgi:hypothetical protein
MFSGASCETRVCGGKLELRGISSFQVSSHRDLLCGSCTDAVRSRHYRQNECEGKSCAEYGVALTLTSAPRRGG